MRDEAEVSGACKRVPLAFVAPGELSEFLPTAR